MKLSGKYAMVCGTGAFMLICYSSFFNLFSPTEMLATGMVSLDPMRLLQVMGWCFAGAFVAGFFGFQIGAVMGNPKGPLSSPVASKSRRKLAEERLLAELEKAESQGLGQVAEEVFGQGAPMPGPDMEP